MFQKASFDLKLPRRSLLVQFTCNACGERTERTINRVAYERGTVFVQVPLSLSPILVILLEFSAAITFTH